ncbi:MAG: DUF4097 family beta strand repeat protein [Cryobacterium sp.]|nr:DUF4097 family beta strand repeat protein [Cryobacterium sp.]MBX3103751.1 DUF4097 family beta strand repeat protein [Cryobacterium sp.]
MAIEKWLVDSEKVIDVENVRKLKIALIRGKVDVIGHDEPTARIEVHSVHGKPLLVSLENETLTIDHPQIGWEDFIQVFTNFKGSARADVSVLVPKDVALNLGVVSANALVSGLTEEARINTVSGDVVVDNVYGDVDLKSVSGETAVRNHYGNVTAKSVSGDITASGEIMQFSSNSVSGDAFADIKGTPDKVSLRTVSGEVTVRLEAGVPARYKVNTISGRLNLDDSEITGVKGQFTGKFGELSGSWADLTVSTVSGDITVVHSTDATSKVAK